MPWGCCSTTLWTLRGPAIEDGWQGCDRKETGEDVCRCCRPSPFRPLSHRLLDVHRCRCQPELDLHAAFASEACASQAMQLLRQAEGALAVDLSLHEPSLPQG